MKPLLVMMVVTLTAIIAGAILVSNELSAGWALLVLGTLCAMVTLGSASRLIK